jgi:hypothetical protein
VPDHQVVLDEERFDSASGAASIASTFHNDAHSNKSKLWNAFHNWPVAIATPNQSFLYTEKEKKSYY